MQGHEQKANPGEQLACIGPPKSGPKVERAYLCATGVMLASGQTFLGVTFLSIFCVVDNGIAAKMNERAGNARGGFNAGSAYDVAGRAVLQHEKIMFIAGLRHGPGEAVDRVIDLSAQGIAIRHQ